MAMNEQNGLRALARLPKGDDLVVGDPVVLSQVVVLKGVEKGVFLFLFRDEGGDAPLFVVLEEDHVHLESGSFLGFIKI